MTRPPRPPRLRVSNKNVASPRQETSPAIKDAVATPPTLLQGPELAHALYEHCCAQPPGTVFGQDDLLASSVVPNDDLNTLLSATQRLTGDKRFRLMESGSKKVHWRCRQPNVAKLLISLDEDCNLVYEYVETAGRDGTWTQNIMKRSKLHKGIMDKSLKILEQKRLIKPVTDHRFPSRRTFMIIGLQPLETVTGGPFYNEGELDDEFVHHLTGYIERWVVSRSWAFPKNADGKPHGKKRKHASDAPENREQAESIRASALDHDVDDPEQQVRPFPGGYIKYPSIGQITNALNDSGIAKTTLRIADVQTLVDVLVWDGKFEAVQNRDPQGGEATTYRSIQKVVTEDVKGDTAGITSLTEAPCGRCPVFDFCQEDGLVNAKSCQYLQEWLNL